MSGCNWYDSKSITKVSKHYKKESDLARDAVNWLNKQPKTYFFKIHGGPYQQAGISDLLGVVNGVFVAIELKVGKNTTTKLQRTFLKTIKRKRFRHRKI